MKNRLYDVIKVPVIFIIKLLYSPKVVNKEKIPVEGPVILAANHRYALDPVLFAMSTRRSIYFLAKKELFFPVFRSLLKGIGAIPIDRSKKNKSARDEAKSYLDKGAVLSIFPEATRNRTDELLPFKFGAVSLAQKTNAYIVPSAITGEFSFFKRNIRIVYGNPFKISKDMNLEDANELLKKKIEDLLK